MEKDWCRWLASKAPSRYSPEQYARLVKRYYDGPTGWFTLLSGILIGHETLASRIIGPQGFDIRGCKRILDVGCGNGRCLQLLLQLADEDAVLIGCDLSRGMLRRARHCLQSQRPSLFAADLRAFPYRDASFDAVVCGWALEHLQDIRSGLREIARVLRPGGKALILTTETSLVGAIRSRIYHCRTTRRSELQAAAAECRLAWLRSLWWSRLHWMFGLGGIVVEFRRT